MKNKCPAWRGGATVRPRRQGHPGLAFIGAKRKPLTEGADGSGADFGQEGQEIPVRTKKILSGAVESEAICENEGGNFRPHGDWAGATTCSLTIASV